MSDEKVSYGQKSVYLLKRECPFDEKEGMFIGRLSAAELRAIAPTAEHGWRVELRPLGSYAYAVRAEGDTLQEAETNAIETIQDIQRMFAIMNIFAGAPHSAAEAVALFLARWSRLPPLVRAGWAGGEVERIRGHLRRHRDIMAFHQRFTQLERRGRVNDLFSRADSAWLDLLVALTVEADSEAERAGIDLDTRYAPNEWEANEAKKAVMGTAQLARHIVGDDELVKAKLDSLGEQIASEIDAEMVKAWDEVEGKRPTFAEELRNLINRHSRENRSDTPDDLLATLLLGTLDTYEGVIRERDRRAKG